MIDMKSYQDMALSFPFTKQIPHHERIGFKITGRRMFTTYLEKNNTANIFLTNIYPVPNKWGEKGATTFALDTVAKELVMEALLSAYNEIVKKKMIKSEK